MFLVVVMKPMSDLCWQCQKNSTAITRSANRPEEEKTSVCNYNIYCANMYVCVRDRERCKERERRKEKEGREREGREREERERGERKRREREEREERERREREKRREREEKRERV